MRLPNNEPCSAACAIAAPLLAMRSLLQMRQHRDRGRLPTPTPHSTSSESRRPFLNAGGASNSGGAVLRSFFTDTQLAELTARIDIAASPGLDYYPLPRPGERFPVNDPELPPRMKPRPESDVEFLHGLLEGIADVEARAYGLLRDMGASPLTKVDNVLPPISDLFYQTNLPGRC